jgi:Cof subfamily protein (haloacid dehalogenase superfamily)
VVRGRTGIFRLAAIDLDGTLLRSDGTISARTRTALRAAEAGGIGIVLVSARGPMGVLEIAESLALHGEAICSNGAFVVDLATRRTIRQRLLETETAIELVHELRKQLPGIRFAVEHHDFAHEPGFSAWNWTPPPGTRVADIVELLAEPATKLILRHAEHETEAIQNLARNLVGERLTVVASGSEAVEVTAAGVNKATAVAELGVAAERAVAFGDYPNDIPMLQWAYHGVAMGNAHPDVIAIADEVTATNDEDGVAVVLERLAG